MNTLKTSFFWLLLLLFTGWNNVSFSQVTIAEWTFPGNPDNSLVDVSVPINAAATIISQGGTGVVAFTNAGATTNSSHATTWNSGSGLKYWEITIATTGYADLWISSKQRSSSTGPRDFKMQYRIGAGVWTDVPGATAIVLADNWISGVLNTVLLPAACDNQPAVSIRWIMTTNTAVNLAAVASGGVSNIDDINITWAVNHYYRSVMSGTWATLATWESSPDNLVWNPATAAPSNYSKTITVRTPHIVTVNTAIKTDETVVENGATLNWASAVLTVVNGPGIDLIVDGTLADNSSSNVIFNSPATWSLGIAGTVIKTSAGSSNNWRDSYNTGIANISSTANWIIRKTGAANPSVSTVSMYYPNLTIENNAGGNWVAFGSSGFQGNSTNTVIKGSMDIGGSGSGTVEFENINTNANATLVLGSLNIRTGNTLRNYGTGFEIYGNVICNGTLLYDANDARRLIFTGSGAQSVSGGGNMNVWNMIMNKSLNDLTLNRTVKVDNNITFNNPGGRIFSSSTNLLILESVATATGANNTSFVHGPVRKLGTAAFTFPVGKNNDYQAIGMGVGAGGPGGTFWTDDFGAGCNSGQLANVYSGVNGAWSITSTGLNEVNANTWFVSASENGVGTGNCGAGCGTNRTLHLGSTFPVDIGAAYLETDAFTCSFIGICSATDKRVESPTINCTGQSTITLSFNYIEYGDGLNDNATLWYSDGATWSLLADMPKTLCCGGVTCNGSLQGIWNAYSIALPASANNNPNVKVGFRWFNNADGIATDPSFAVDDVRLSVAGATETFTAEYFKSDPQTDFNNVVNPFIDHISQCEYWILTRDAGSSTRTITLTWDNNSCGVTNLGDLTVARFNGASWDDRGNGGTTGSLAAGTITSAAAQTAYGPFTLASTTPQNPLPVELISFEAAYKKKNVDVSWVTASEINSDYFNVLRSGDGLVFEDLISYKAAGNSSSMLRYTHVDDEPLPGISYYQLKQVDFDGTAKFSKTIAVRAPASTLDFTIVSTIQNSNDHSMTVNIYSKEDLKLQTIIYDATGKEVYSDIVFVNEGLNAIPLNGLSLQKGIYSLHISTGDMITSTRFMY